MRNAFLFFSLLLVGIPKNNPERCDSLSQQPICEGVGDILSADKNDAFVLAEESFVAPLLVDSLETTAVTRSVASLKEDFNRVTGITPIVHTQLSNDKRQVIIGSIGNSRYIDQLVKEKKIDGTELKGKREKFIIQTVEHPFPGVDEALVIAGSDKRGTVYGVYELSAQMGVSPWYYWADVPVRKKDHLYIKRGSYTDGEPAVKYRGIFLNDEAPALTGWVNENFGGYNHRFYEKVFELLLRLKANYLWPAMWDAAFYDDDPMNSKLADEMGIVMGTSHHEPLARAHKEWKRYGKGPWNYATNKAVLDDFWRKGVERMKHTEDVLTIGMRGDGDEPMSENANIALLEKIVKDQRKIIADVTGKKASETPQIWALYKEVQEYYDKGMRVPDDVTLLLCDDNWGNVRKLPSPTAKKRKGGYGMYYHFDYVGGPRNYKWLNVSQVQRIWEQMNLTYRYGVDELWVVNVGDLKPMEYPIQFFMDMAWNPERFKADNLLKHTEEFCARQFGERYAKEAARLINLYTKYNRRVTPELLNQKTYSLHNYNEFKRVVDDYQALLLDALKLNYLLPADCRDAYDELVLFPIQACANLYELYYAVAMNHDLAEINDVKANSWADKVEECYMRDSLLTRHYNKEIAGGKWNHMMDQTHIGYTYWQEPRHNVMPAVIRVPQNKMAPLPPLFKEADGYVSIEAEHYSRAMNGEHTHWVVIPDLGKTLSAVTTTPVTLMPDKDTYLEYDMELTSTGEMKLEILVSPTLNFNENKGLRYAVSFDGGEEQVVNINGPEKARMIGFWQANSINRTVTTHKIITQGKHILRFRPLDPGIVLQKLMLDTGDLKRSYLGAPESKME
ncbi:glycosyl hydrolase 115 family protein [uncultured Bacteroides sp.]|uniref:glycosyl hydrolase 115 family protein n=1 Tax=uncultured Bacteroides sp. TaxID=162156 RepID=UPI002AAA94C6|nr:glycosyl hydrolase 115 family protein [uncultured Bacteroides sp.]